MTENQVKHYNKSKTNFERAKDKKLSNILEQRVSVSIKVKKLLNHFTKLKEDFENLKQQEFPPIEEYYQRSTEKSNEEIQLDSFSKEQLQEVLEYTSNFPISTSELE